MDPHEHLLGNILSVGHKVLSKDRHRQPEDTVAIPGHQFAKCRVILLIATAADEVIV